MSEQTEQPHVVYKVTDYRDAQGRRITQRDLVGGFDAPEGFERFVSYGQVKHGNGRADITFVIPGAKSIVEAFERVDEEFKKQVPIVVARMREEQRKIITVGKHMAPPEGGPIPPNLRMARGGNNRGKGRRGR